MVKTNAKEFMDNVTYYMKLALAGKDIEIAINDEKSLKLQSMNTETKPDITEICTHSYNGKSTIVTYGYPVRPYKECMVCGKVFPLKDY